MSVRLVAVELPTLALKVLSPFVRPETRPNSVVVDELLKAAETSAPFKVTATASPLLASDGKTSSIKALPPLTIWDGDDFTDMVGAEVGGEVGGEVVEAGLDVSLLPQPLRVAIERIEMIPARQMDRFQSIR